MKSLILVASLFIINTSLAQNTTTKEQDGVLLSYELKKSGGDSKADKYIAMIKAENRNDFDVFYPGLAKPSLSNPLNPDGFTQFKVSNTTGFLAANVSYLRGQATDMFVDANQKLFKLERGKIITKEFSFKVKAGQEPVIVTTFTGSLKPLSYYKLYSTQNTGSSSTARNVLSVGQRLNINDVLTSENGMYISRLQADGNFCVYKRNASGNESFVWCSSTNGKSGSTLRMQDDGNLVLYTNSESPVWSTSTTGYFDSKYNLPGNKPVRLVMENDGRLVLYSATGKNVWSSPAKTTTTTSSSISKPFPDAKFPMTIYNAAGNMMPAKHSLKINDCLSSENQQYYLVLQADGNLCIYKRTDQGRGTFVWGTMTNGKGVRRLELQDDGNLVLYTEGNVAVWSSKTMRHYDAKFSSSTYKPVKLVLENDGQLVLYSETGNKAWSNR
jgi:hypothetical protein